MCVWGGGGGLGESVLKSGVLNKMLFVLICFLLSSFYEKCRLHDRKQFQFVLDCSAEISPHFVRISMDADQSREQLLVQFVLPIKKLAS